MKGIRAAAERAWIRATARPGRVQHLNRAMFQASLRGLGYCGSWEIDQSGEAWFLKHVIAPELEGRYGGTIVDVGANRGDYSRAALRLTSASKVIGFEPQAACWPDLEALAVEYGDRFAYHPRALGAEVGTATIRYGDPGSEWASLAGQLPDFAERVAVHTATVSVATLDQMFDPWEGVHLLKIDVEGWEQEVLRGAQRLIRSDTCRPRWVQLEWNLHQLGRGHTLHALADLLPRYRPYVLLPHALRPLDLRRPEDNVFSYANLIFRAREL